MNALFRDSYLRECETTITAVSSDPEHTSIMCRDLLFFPKGGGQPSDEGTVKIGDLTLAVQSLAKEKGDVWIRLGLDNSSQPGNALRKGQTIQCQVNWERRFRAMRMHSLQHTIAAAIHARFGEIFETHGMELEEDLSQGTMTFSLDGSSWKLGDTGLIVEDIKKLIKIGHTIRAETFESLDAIRVRYPRIFRCNPDLTIKGRVRTVVIEEVDANPCGGTHVSNTHEIGNFSLLDVSLSQRLGCYDLHFTV